MFPVTLDLAICTTFCQEAVLLRLRRLYKSYAQDSSEYFLTIDFVYLEAKAKFVRIDPSTTTISVS